MSVISQREIQIGAKTLIIYVFDYSGAVEDIEVPASVQQVAGLHMDAGLSGVGSGITIPSVVMSDTGAVSSTTYTRTVRIGTIAGPVGRVLICALSAGAPGGMGISQDSSISAHNYIISPK